jgi:glycosyltransferase involved in cell wall biosynthesis
MSLEPKIKVFHILSNPSIGGIEGMLSELVPRIDSARCDMRVVNMRSKSMAYELWDQAGTPYHKLKTPGKLLLGSVIGLARLLHREKPDVVEIYGLRANIIGRLAAKIARVPVILTGVLSTDDWRKWYHVWLDRATSWAVKGWIANAHACKQSLIEREKHPADRIRVIYDGIDVNYWTRNSDTSTRLAFRDSWGYNEDNIVFVTIANLRPDKGVQFLIEAIPEVVRKCSNVRFVLVGLDMMGGQLQRRCKQLKIEYAVTFAGFRKDIRDIYEAADATVLPSLREGLPICLIEAMSMELPVVATAVSGTPELVNDGVTGVLVPPKDVEALAKPLIKIASNSEQRKRMGLAAKRRVCEMFTIERMIEELLDYYQRQFESASRKES